MITIREVFFFCVELRLINGPALKIRKKIFGLTNTITSHKQTRPAHLSPYYTHMQKKKCFIRECNCISLNPGLIHDDGRYAASVYIIKAETKIDRKMARSNIGLVCFIVFFLLLVK